MQDQLMVVGDFRSYDPLNTTGKDDPQLANLVTTTLHDLLRRAVHKPTTSGFCANCRLATTNLHERAIDRNLSGSWAVMPKRSNPTSPLRTHQQALLRRCQHGGAY
jgi:hypothetical protein